MDDVFADFNSEKIGINDFILYLNNKCELIKFTFELEQNFKRTGFKRYE